MVTQTRAKMTVAEATSFGRYSVGNAIAVKGALKCGCEPYEDVFTYRRWQAQGLQVRRGERAIKLPVVSEHETEEDDGTVKTRRVLHTSAVFCRCQVDGANGNGGGERIPPATIDAPAWEPPKIRIVPAPSILYFPTIRTFPKGPSVASGGFPGRRGWPKNAKGGLRVSPYTMKRTRHEGVRCYGDHVGSKCYRYDFAQHPSIPQAPYIPSWVSTVARLAQTIANAIARVRYYNLDKQAA